MMYVLERLADLDLWVRYGDHRNVRHYERAQKEVMK